MASEYLYGKLPVFDGKEFEKFLKEAPVYKVEYDCVLSENK